MKKKKDLKKKIMRHLVNGGKLLVRFKFLFICLFIFLILFVSLNLSYRNCVIIGDMSCSTYNSLGYTSQIVKEKLCSSLKKINMIAVNGNELLFRMQNDKKMKLYNYDKDSISLSLNLKNFNIVLGNKMLLMMSSYLFDQNVVTGRFVENNDKLSFVVNLNDKIIFSKKTDKVKWKELDFFENGAFRIVESVSPEVAAVVYVNTRNFHGAGIIADSLYCNNANGTSEHTMGGVVKAIVDAHCDDRSSICKENLKKLDELPQDYNVYIAKGFIKEKLHKLNSLYEISHITDEYREAIKLNPERYEAYFRLSNVYSLESDFDSALRILDEYVNNNEKTEQYWVDRGIIYINSLDYRSAVENLKNATKLNHDNYKAVFLQGYCAYWNEDYENAILKFERSILLKQDFMAAHLYLGLAYSKRGKDGDRDMGLKAFESASEHAPKNPVPYHYLGLIKEGMGDFEGAIAAYKKSCDCLQNGKNLDIDVLSALRNEIWIMQCDEKKNSNAIKQLYPMSNDQQLELTYSYRNDFVKSHEDVPLLGKIKFSKKSNKKNNKLTTLLSTISVNSNNMHLFKTNRVRYLVPEFIASDLTTNLFPTVFLQREKLVKGDYSGLSTYLKCALLYCKLKRIEELKILLKKVQSITSYDAVFLKSIVSALLNVGDRKSAKEIFTSRNDSLKNSTDPDSCLNLACLLTEPNLGGSFDEIRNKYKMAIDLVGHGDQEKKAKFCFLYGLFLLKSGMMDDAKEQFDNAKKMDGSLACVYVGLGIYYSRFNIEKARLNFEKGLNRAPCSVECLNNYAMTSLITNKDINIALDALNKATFISHQPIIKYNYATALAFDHNFKAASKQLEGALNIVSKCISVGKIELACRLMYIQILVELGEYGKAASVCQDTWSRFGDNSRVYFLRGNVLGSWGASEQDSSRLCDACQKLQKSIDINPNNSEAYLSKGMYLDSLADLDVEKTDSFRQNATIAFCNATMIDPNCADAFSCWGACLTKKGLMNKNATILSEACRVFTKYKDVTNDTSVRVRTPRWKTYLDWSTALTMLGAFSDSKEKYKEGEAVFSVSLRDATENKATVFQKRGIILYSAAKVNSDYEILLSACDKFKKSDECKKDPLTYIYWGEALFWGGSEFNHVELLEEACRKYSFVIDSEQYKSLAYISRGIIRIYLARIRKSCSILKDACSDFSIAEVDGSLKTSVLANWGAALVELANMSGKEDDFSAAEQKLLSATARGDAASAINLARLYCNWAVSSNNPVFFNKAEAVLVKQKGDCAESPLFWAAYGDILRMRGEVLQDENSDGPNVDIYFSYYEQADSKYKKAKLLGVKNADFFNVWGAMLRKMGDICKNSDFYSQSIDRFKKSSEIEPNVWHTYESWAISLFNLTTLNRDVRNCSEIQRLIEKAGRCGLKSSYVYYNKGANWGLWGRLSHNSTMYSNACTEYSNAEKIGFDNAELLYSSWGEILLRLVVDKKSISFSDSVVKKFETWLQKLPDSFVLLLGRGDSLLLKAQLKKDVGLLSDCANVFRQVPEGCSLHGDAIFGIGDSFLKLGQWQGCLKYLNWACREFTKAEEIGVKLSFIELYSEWGIALGEIGKIRKMPDFYDQSCVKFEKAAKLASGRERKKILQNWKVTLNLWEDLGKDEKWRNARRKYIIWSRREESPLLYNTTDADNS